jgi:hypothetical protein
MQEKGNRMKTNFAVLSTVPVLTAILALNSIDAQAQTQVPGTSAYYYEQPENVGFHLGADGGASIMQNFDSSRLDFAGRFHTRPGGRVDVAPEYDLVSGGGMTLGAEAEAGTIYNYINRVDNAGATTFAHGQYYQVPFLGGLTLKLHPSSFVTPFIGVDGGGDYSHMRLNPSGFFGPPQRSDEVDPALQATGGILFNLNSRCALGCAYKWLAAFPNENQTTCTHAALVSFNFRF